MKTNFQMIRDFRNFKPEECGILSGKEVTEIEVNFEIKNRSDLDLQNLRDFIVLYYSTKYRDDYDQWDIMSGICGVIDREKFRRGMEI